MAPKRILLVDDSVRDTELAVDALQHHHLANQLIVLRDGVEALDFLYRRARCAEREAGHPAFFLPDLKMPRVVGLAVLRQNKHDPVLRVIPVVVMTSSREEQDLVESYRLGVNAYIVKPLEFHSFVDAMKVVGTFWAVLNERPGSVNPP